MYQKSLESLIKTANQAGAIVICEYRWPASWPSCWDYQSLTCILNMNEAQHELRWMKLKPIWGGTNRLPNALLEQPCYN